MRIHSFDHARSLTSPNPSSEDRMARLKDLYFSTVAPGLMKEFNFKSPMQVPRMTKIVINIGLGEALQNPKAIEAAIGDLTMIAGQKPVVTRAKKSLAAFKLRQGMPIGAMVTLRNERMYDFYDRLVNLALPRIRDFQGLSRKSFDGRGNYSIGIREQIIFPEIDYDDIAGIRGLDIAITTSAKTDEHAL